MAIEQILKTYLGDTARDIELEFDDDGTLIDWGAENVSDVVFFAWALGSDTPTINGAAAATDANGVLKYTRSSLDLPERRRYVGRFKVTYTDSTTEHLPAGDEFIIAVQ